MTTLKDCIDFANSNPVCYLATADGNQPRVRALGFWYADATGFYFQTATLKEIPAQIKANPNVEACFYHHEGMIGATMRVAGKAEFVDDRAMKERVLQERGFLKSFGFTPDSPELVIFRICHGQAYFWTMESNLAPKRYIEF